MAPLCIILSAGNILYRFWVHSRDDGRADFLHLREEHLLASGICKLAAMLPCFGSRCFVNFLCCSLKETFSLESVSCFVYCRSAEIISKLPTTPASEPASDLLCIMRSEKQGRTTSKFCPQ